MHAANSETVRCYRLLYFCVCVSVLVVYFLNVTFLTLRFTLQKALASQVCYATQLVNGVVSLELAL